jgi:hypothetical protein
VVAWRMDAAATGRRALFRLAFGLAAASVLGRKAALAQDYSETTISQAAQQARREAGRFGRRADNLLRLTIADGPGRNAVAVRRFRAEQVLFSRALVQLINTRVSEDDWLLIVPTRVLDLALAMQPLDIRIAPTAEEVEAEVAKPLPQVEPLVGDTADDVLLTLVLDMLGLERHVAMFEQLRNDRALQPALRAAAAALQAHRYGLASFALEWVMVAITLPHNIDTIREDLGEAGVRRLYKALVARFVPFLGWTLFDTALLAAIYYNGDTTALILHRG